jgi:hypothetical protein
VNSAPSVSLGPDINLCTTAQTTLNAGSFNSYSWSDGSTASSLVVDGTTLAPGTYTYYVTVTNTDNCTGTDTVLVNVSVCTGIANNEHESDVIIAPNPNNGTFMISITNTHNASLNMEIFSVEGQQVQSQVITRPGGEQIDVSHLAKGVYFIQLTDADKRLVKRMIIE